MECLQYKIYYGGNENGKRVLNLVISGMPSILSPDYAQSQNGALF